jgi:hypothetical protein
MERNAQGPFGNRQAWPSADLFRSLAPLGSKRSANVADEQSGPE